jgi:dTDP-4-amino-4,6-dideoxygalactose transaminase
VITSDDALYRRAHGFHSHYRTPGEGPSDSAALNGINLRMAEFQAALLLAQLKRLEEQARMREQNAAYLTGLLPEVPGVQPAMMYDGCTRNAYHIHMMRYNLRSFTGLSRAVRPGGSRRRHRRY